MKKVLFTSMMVFAIACSASAQTAKGTWLLGGGANFKSTDGTTVWSLTPELGMFVKDNLAIGGTVGLSGSDGETMTNIGAFVKPYFGKSENGKMFAKASLGSMDSQFTYGAGLGYASFLNKSVALELGANYHKMGDLPGSFGLGVGFQIHFKK